MAGYRSSTVPRILCFSAVTLAVLTLAGCGRFGREERAAWRSQAEQMCVRSGAVKPTWAIERMGGALNGAGTCGMDMPYKVQAFSGGTVNLSSKLTLGCPMVAATDRWVAEIVQPAATTYFGQNVTEMKMGSYNCRPRNNQSGAKLSEHSFGNAIDVFSFRLADGRNVTVKGGWKGEPAEQDFLRQVLVQSCGAFRTVLGPGADMFHYDHFHLDLGRSSSSGKSYCRPILKWTPPQPGMGVPDGPGREVALLPQMRGQPGASFTGRSQTSISTLSQPSGRPVDLSQGVGVRGGGWNERQAGSTEEPDDSGTDLDGPVADE